MVSVIDDAFRTANNQDVLNFRVNRIQVKQPVSQKYNYQNTSHF